MNSGQSGWRVRKMPQRMSQICEETQEKENSPLYTDIADVGSLATKISDTPPNHQRKTNVRDTLSALDTLRLNPINLSGSYDPFLFSSV
jgi:hypothetical protein